MKNLILLILLAPTLSFAVTNGYFPFTGMQGMVNIATSGSAGNENDPDPVKLYMDMNVPAESSFVGLGKTIKSSDGTMSIVCADRSGGNYHCSIVVKKGPGAVIKPSQKYFEYRISGQECEELFLKFNNSVRGEFVYENGDQRLKILSRRDIFQLTFQDYSN